VVDAIRMAPRNSGEASPGTRERALRFDQPVGHERGSSRELTGPMNERRGSTSSREVETRGEARVSMIVSEASSRAVLDRKTTRRRTTEDRVGSQMDVMFVFPCKAQDLDNEEDAEDNQTRTRSSRYRHSSSFSLHSAPLLDTALPSSPVSRPSEPSKNSARWYTASVCKANFDSHGFRRGSMATSSSDGDVDRSPIKTGKVDVTVIEETDGDGGEPVDIGPELQSERPQEDEQEVEQTDEPDLPQLMALCNVAETMDELRRRVADLFIGFLVSKHCGFQVRAFTGADGMELFVAVCASEAILRAHADMMKVELQLDNEISSQLLSKGKVASNEIIPPYVKYDVDEEELLASKLSKSPFRLHMESYREGSIFTSTDRIRIIMGAVKQAFHVDGMVELGLMNCWYPVHNQAGLQGLVNSFAMVEFAKEHHPQDTRRSWHVDNFLSATVSTETIFRYFGAKLAFDVAFIRYLIRQTLPLAILTPFLFLVPDAYHFQVSMLVGFILIIWAATMEEFWKRTENRLKVDWGVESSEASESVRHQFRGDYKRSPVDRTTLIKLDPDHLRLARYMFTSIITAIYMTVVVCSSLWLYNQHDVLEQAGRLRMATLVNAAIAILLFVYNAVWDWLAEKLTIIDNYRTDSLHNEALLLRVFRCRFITSYVSLFYIAFLKNFLATNPEIEKEEPWVGENGKITESACIRVVREQLRFFFAINIFYHGVAVAVPFFTHRLQLWLDGDMELWKKDNPYQSLTTPPEAVAEQGNVGWQTELQRSGTSRSSVSPSSPDASPRRRPRRSQARMHTTMLGNREPAHVANRRSYPEAQSRLPEYKVVHAIADRMDLVVELGYVLFFGLVAPEVVILFVLSAMIRLHVLGLRLVHAMRRPFPYSSSGLGVVFEHVQVIMAQAAVACNVVLILLSNASRPAEKDLFQPLRGMLTTPDETYNRLHDYKAMLTMFMVLVGLIMYLRFFIDFAIPDTPSDVLLQQARQATIADELLKIVVADMKQWEGKELERAYTETLPRHKMPCVLTKAHVWVPIQPSESLVTGGHAALPWTPEDQGFEECEMF